MHKFRTSLEPSTTNFNIDHQHRVLAIGSCFAEHISHKLITRKFSVQLNPFGILYNPVSIAQSLQFLLDEAPFPEELLFNHQGLWHSFAHHSRFSHPDKAQAFRQIQNTLKTARNFLQTADRLLITFGTAYAFELNANRQIVANCHKLPASQFTRKRLSVDAISDSFVPLFEKLLDKEERQIILSVSPVRHLRDGLIDNQRSKAILLLVIEKLCQTFPNVHYFPAYELLLDDLRDYRFYADDLLHPNQQAIQYIWSFFEKTFFSESTMHLNVELKKLHDATNHRPFFPETPQHQSFIKSQLQKIAALEMRHPDISFEKEKARFLEQLVK